MTPRLQLRTTTDRPVRAAILLMTTLASLAPPATAQRPIAAPHARRSAAHIEEALLITAPRVQWPGFDAARIPLAIFDGDSTWLFRHPAPPPGFVPRAGDGAPAVMPGRHPALSANSSADIGGHLTATLVVDGPRVRSDPARLSAIAIHEAFHVFQRTRHAGWSGNEGDVLRYPFEDARRLALRRLETDALRRAQRATIPAESRCWARRFMNVRYARFAGADSAFVTYERLTELNEGLATYVETVARGDRTVPFPRDEFAAGAVRLRAYTTGAALGLLLDRFSPDWKTALEANDKRSLDELLGEALARETDRTPDCMHTLPERRMAERRAAADSASVIARRVTRRTAFDTRDGLRLVVVADRTAPLWPQGFDPLNLERVQGGLLHTRFLKLGNAAGTIEMLHTGGADPEALTVGAGAHPLFDGVQRLIVAGVPAPAVREERGAVTITAPGVSLALTGATLHREGSVLVVTLAPRP